jgi:hypothetical protein
MLTAVGGGLLLFGAAQHLLAKTMSLIVGAAFGAAAVIALVSGNVLGMAAANGWTKLGWAVCAVILLFNTLVPRRRREVVVDEPGARGAPVARDRRPVTAEDDAPVADRADRDVHEPAAVRRDEEPTTVHRGDEDSTVVDRSAEDPTVVHRGDEPGGLRRDEVATHSETRRD